MSPWLLPQRLKLCLLCHANQPPWIILLFIIQFLIISRGPKPTWYATNSDYDITGLIRYYISEFTPRARRDMLKSSFTRMKIPSWKHRLEMNLFPLTTSGKHKCLVKSKGWSYGSTKREGRLSPDGVKLVYVRATNQHFLGSLSMTLTFSSMEIILMKVFCKSNLQGP